MNDVTVQRLLKHGPFLRGLARSLVGDAARADDVVQDAWLAALRGAPEQPGRLRPWLAGVVRNLARKTHRERDRRARRERAAARRDYVRSTADIVDQEALRRDVVRAVLALEEPCRTALLLRFYDDLPPREIAKRCGVSGSTVRTRIQRGLAEVKGRLDRARGDRRAWSLGLVPIAAAGAQPAAAGAALMGGGLAMKSKLVWVAVVFVCASLWLLWWSSLREGRERSTETASVAAPTAAPRSAAEDERRSEAAGPRPKDASASAGKIPLTGVVLLSDGARGEAVTLVVSAEPPVEGERVEVNVASGEEFRVGVDALFATKFATALKVELKHERHLPHSMRHPVVLDPVDRTPVLERLEVTLIRGGIVRGTVQGPAGEAMRRVTVAAYRLMGDVPAEVSAAANATGPEGRFRLDLAEDGDYLVVAIARDYRPVARVARVKVGEELELETLALRPGETITGRVTTTGGRTGLKTTILARLAEKGHVLAVPRTGVDVFDRNESLFWTPKRLEHAIVSVQTDGEGFYRLGGLESTRYTVELRAMEDAHFGVFVGRPGALFRRAATAPAAGIDFEVGVVTLALLVRHDGAGLEDISVAVTDVWKVEGGSSTYGSSYETGADGRVRLLARPGATYALQLAPVGFAPQRKEITIPAAGGRLEVVFDLEKVRNKATLVVTLRPRAPAPLPPLPPHYRFELHPVAGGDGEYTTRTAEEGRFVWADLEPGAFRLVARAGSHDARGGGYYLDVESRVQLTAGATTDETLFVEPGGRIKILTRTAEGRTDTACDCWLETLTGERSTMSFAKYKDPSSSWSSGGQLPAVTGPAWGLEAVRPGTYRVHVKPKDKTLRAASAQVRIEAGKTTFVEIPLKR